jgi:hypothetical protein
VMLIFCMLIEFMTFPLSHLPFVTRLRETSDYSIDYYTASPEDLL